MKKEKVMLFFIMMRSLYPIGIVIGMKVCYNRGGKDV